jgi:hypothetical protein
METPGTGHGRDVVEIFCGTPVLATHPQGHILPLVGPHPLGETAKMRLGVGEPPKRVGCGAGPSSRALSTCTAV